MLIKQSGNTEFYIYALRSKWSWILLCLSLYLGTWLQFFIDWCFADQDREREPNRAFNGIHPHYLSVHRPPSQDNDLNILLVCFYLSRFCSVLIVSIKIFYLLMHFSSSLGLDIDIKHQLDYWHLCIHYLKCGKLYCWF